MPLLGISPLFTQITSFKSTWFTSVPPSITATTMVVEGSFPCADWYASFTEIPMFFLHGFSKNQSVFGFCCPHKLPIARTETIKILYFLIIYFLLQNTMMLTALNGTLVVSVLKMYFLRNDCKGRHLTTSIGAIT